MAKYPVGLGDILGEFRLFVAASGILFGFLLNVAFTRGKDTLTVELIFMVLALACAAISVLIFLLPAIYHHSHSFPLTEEEAEKIYIRSHRFALWGIITLIMTIYFSLILAFYSIFSWLSFVMASIILVIPAMLFILRKKF